MNWMPCISETVLAIGGKKGALLLMTIGPWNTWNLLMRFSLTVVDVSAVLLTVMLPLARSTVALILLLTDVRVSCVPFRIVLTAWSNMIQGRVAYVLVKVVRLRLLCSEGLAL